jgi:transforming growth factor-beta-induced protein
MRNLSWTTIALFASLTTACGDDATPTSNVPQEGSAGTGGANAAAGAGPTPGASGSTTGGSGGAAGGAAAGGPSSAGQAGAPTAGGSGGSGGATALKDIVDTAVAAGTFTELAKALTAADLVTTLKGPGPFTVFAPTDAAFAKFEMENKGVLGMLSKADLTAILTYHVVGAAAKSDSLKDDQVFVTVNGSPLLIDLTGGVKAGGSNVTTPDVLASNGVIHVIDQIILPPTKDIVETAVAAGGFTKLAGALTSAGLVETLKGKGPFTVFAPTDAAFDKLPSVPTGDALKNILLYHVASGAVGSGDLTAGMVPTLLTGKSVTIDLTASVKVNASNVTSANIIAKNGVIHVIDTVLTPAP